MSSYYNKGDAPSWEALDQDGLDDVIDTSEYAYASRDHILFCIDAAESMHKPYPDTTDDSGQLIRGRSALHQALDVAHQIQRAKVLSGPDDSVGLLLYNVDPSAVAEDPGNYQPGNFVFQTLRTINAEEMKRLAKLMQTAKEQYEAQGDDEAVETTEPEILRETFPPIEESHEMNIANVIQTCNFLFRDGGTQLKGNKRVFWITDNDMPPGSNNRQPARTSYGDLTTYGVAAETFFIDRPDHRFNPNIFWNDILDREAIDYNEDQPDPDGLSSLADLMKDLVIKTSPKRSHFHVPLKLGKDGEIVIGVSGYSMVSEQSKGASRYVKMRGQAVEEVQAKTEYTSAETGAVLKDSEIGHAYEFGNEAEVRNILEPNPWEAQAKERDKNKSQKAVDHVLEDDKERRQREDEGEHLEEEGEDDKKVIEEWLEKQKAALPKIVARTRLQFSNEEVFQFRSMGIEPQIKILGFQAASHLRFQDNLKHPFFIYPNEEEYTGSTRTFAALLSSCLKYNRHALALCRLRSNHVPEFCVLIPQEEKTSSNGQEYPPGFHLIILPYKDSIRPPPKKVTEFLQSPPIATDEQIDAMKAIIKRTRFKAAAYRPEIYPNPSLAYHYDQLQALAFEEDWDPEDPDKQALDKTMPLYDGMHSRAGEFMEEFNKEIENDERAVEKLAGPTKRAKAEETTLNEWDLRNIPDMWKKGTLSQCKVQELKDWAKYYHVSLQGKTKKADIIDLVSEHLSTNKDDLAGASSKKAKK
ncbi:ATP-dependent DNA helicase II subunit 1 [Cryptococcus bacillisporus CA1873]|uniref:ATP-dependent DNA helicase II subunit 1 n=1 Tax=Cryptococcus bacillisporus CA1873 TaxID=1296111 RepID=A0ABR5BAP4_CRYGA|nr:ATP-dependent DNA helicase II subunit 1 [Cryptococcus bacillisporus CA1873]|eukprot:KIR62445.1 ATP-dependent DNA helicase II subunit 1 [Cryptococcus gattii CA1873]